MLNNLSFLDAQHIINAKFFLFFYLIFGLTCILSKKINSWVFLLVSGVIMGAGYYVLVDNLQLAFWGLKGDELTIAAMYNTFAHYGFFSDFSYHHLFPFYPPLFFWIIAAAGRLLSLNGIVMIKMGAAAAFIFFPIIFYVIQKLYWRNTRDNNLEVAILLSPLLMMFFVSLDEIFGKPHELFAAAAALYWLLFLYLEIKKISFSFKKIIIFGVWGGIIFMIYYLWLVFAVIALSLLGLTVSKKDQLKFYSRSSLVLFIALVVSLPFWWPLIFSYITYGSENWQAGFFTINNIPWRDLFFEDLNWKTLIMFFGFASIIYNYKEEKFRPLIAALATVYIWWFTGLITLTLFQVPMQEFRGYYYFMPAALAIGLSFGLMQLWSWLDKINNGEKIKMVLSISGLILFAHYSIFGIFIDNPAIQERLIESKQVPARIKKPADYIKNHNSDDLTLNSIPELLAFAPINNFIYFNQHNSHPAANFSERFAYVKEMALSKDSAEFFKKSQNTPFGKINRFILYHAGNNYPLFYQIDKMMTAIEEVQVDLPDNLISEKYFNLVYKYNEYEIWETRSDSNKF